MELEHKIKLFYPLPICQMYQSVRLEHESRNRVRKLVELVEGTAKYLALVSLATYIKFNLFDEHVQSSRMELEKPSFGHWVSLYRHCVNAIQKHHPSNLEIYATDYRKDDEIVLTIRQLNEAIGLSPKFKKPTQFHFLDAVVEFRNRRIAHGNLNSLQAQGIIQSLEAGVNQWLNSLPLFENRNLVYIQHIEYEKPQFINIGVNLNSGATLEVFRKPCKVGLTNQQVYLFDKNQDDYLELHPFLLFDPSMREVYFYSRYKEQQAIFEVPYETPKSTNNPDDYRQFLNIKPEFFFGITSSDKNPDDKIDKIEISTEPKNEDLNLSATEPNVEPESEIMGISEEYKTGETVTRGRWTLAKAVTPTKELINVVGGHPLIARLLAQRGFDTPEKARAFLDPTYYSPAPPAALFGVGHAAEIICEAINARQKILVWGDFDVDGQTSTSLLVAALQKLAGFDRVRFHVPNRFSEGHGMLPDKLAEKLADPTFQPQLIVTCDTGIAEAAGVGYAKDRNITVVVTDHHDLTPEFQKLRPGLDPLWGLAAGEVGQASVRRADAIVNPKFQPVGDPLRTLPGVGVAYKLVQEIYKLCDRAGQENDLLDLVALGIVADVAEQVHDARYLLQLGLDKLRRTKRIGLLALMEVARLNPETVDAESIGFQLGPRMNALGRLEDATVAVELLTTRDIIRASQLAAKMERLNQERRLLTSQITKAAMDMIERDPSLLQFNGLVLAHEAWHAGIVGIVASRLADEYNKPTVLLLKPSGLPARGSARSIPGVDIGGAIAGCSHLLLGHGGHPGAAGLSLPPENIDRFRRELHQQIELHRDSEAPVGLLIDSEANLNQLGLSLAEELQRLAPFGQGNPTPQFLGRNLTVIEDRRLGRDGTHRRLTVQSTDGLKAPVIWFNGADVELPSGPLDLVFTLGINEYRGERTLQLSYIAHRASQFETLEVGAVRQPQRQVQDGRNQPINLRELPTPEQAVWYAEGVQLETGETSVAYAPRTHYASTPKGQALVLWSVPPSPETLRWLLDTLLPTQIYVCGRQTCDDSLTGILRDVAGMCKYALARDRLVYLDRMAARIGTTEAVIRHSLLWLQSRGRVQIEEFLEGDAMRIRAGDGQDQKENADILKAELEEQLAEVRAYRGFFLRARVSELGLTIIYG